MTTVSIDRRPRDRIGVGMINGPIQRRPDILVRLVHVRARRDQHLDHRLVGMINGPIQRRPLKKIITFALFDDQNPSGQPPDIQSESSFSWYLEGALHNMQGAKLYYPEWVVRIYVFGLNETVEALLLESSNYAELGRCWASTPLDVSSSRKMTARFLSYDDPDMMYLISRDLDSRFNPRELFAVNEWISSGAHFHVMRDHDQHDVPVLSGMFGIRRGALTGKVPSMTDLLSSAFAQEPNGIIGMRGEDQSFLAKYVWPLVSSNAITHDVSEERCRRYGSSLCLGFPMGDDDKHSMFVGQDFKPGGHSAGMHVSQYKCTFACESSEMGKTNEPAIDHVHVDDMHPISDGDCSKKDYSRAAETYYNAHRAEYDGYDWVDIEFLRTLHHLHPEPAEFIDVGRPTKTDDWLKFAVQAVFISARL
jgi:hypothetical protein